MGVAARQRVRFDIGSEGKGVGDRGRTRNMSSVASEIKLVSIPASIVFWIGVIRLKTIVSMMMMILMVLMKMKKMKKCCKYEKEK